jgi:hypothetical protein
MKKKIMPIINKSSQSEEGSKNIAKRSKNKKVLHLIMMLLVAFGICKEAKAGTQKYYLEESKRIEGYMSKNEANRVRVEGDRIVEVIGLGEEFGLESDDKLGQIFIKLLDTNSGKKAVFTIVTEKGKTQDVSLKLKKGEGEFVLIRQKEEEKAIEKLMESKHVRHDEIVNMIKYVRGASLKGKGKGYLSKSGLEIKFRGDRSIRKYRVEVWSLVYKGKGKKILFEKQFANEDVAAIMLESRELREGDETTLFKVINSR